MATKRPPINPEQTRTNLQRVQELLATLKTDAQEAVEHKDLYMLSVYEEILSVVSPITQKAIARLEREELALLRKNIADVKLASNGSAS